MRNLQMMKLTVKEKMLFTAPAQQEDTAAILKVRFDAIHKIAPQYYPPDMIHQWANEKRWEDFISNPDGEIRIVVRTSDEIIGFGAIIVAKKELRACYVAPQCAGQGIGSKVVAALEHIAKQHNLKFLELDGSLNAERFYLKNGYHIVERREYVMRNSMTMASVKMKKILT